MITQSTMYAVIENGVVIAKGSAAAMRRLVRILRQAQGALDSAVRATVWNSPSSKLGDKMSPR